MSPAALTNEMDVGRQKLGKNCDFEASPATFSHEMDVGRQKLKKNCDFEVSRATLSHEIDVGRQKPIGKIAILKCPSQPFRTKWTLDVKN